MIDRGRARLRQTLLRSLAKLPRLHGRDKDPVINRFA